MNTMTETNHFTQDDERALLDAIDAWVEKSVKPIAREYDHEDKYPASLVEEMKELVESLIFSSEQRDHRHAVRWPWPTGEHVLKDRHQDFIGVDGADGHFQFAPHHGRGD